MSPLSLSTTIAHARLALVRSVGGRWPRGAQGAAEDGPPPGERHRRLGQAGADSHGRRDGRRFRHGALDVAARCRGRRARVGRAAPRPLVLADPAILRARGWTAQRPAVQAKERKERDESLVRAWLRRNCSAVNSAVGTGTAGVVARCRALCRNRQRRVPEGIPGPVWLCLTCRSAPHMLPLLCLFGRRSLPQFGSPASCVVVPASSSSSVRSRVVWGSTTHVVIVVCRSWMSRRAGPAAGW